MRAWLWVPGSIPAVWTRWLVPALFHSVRVVGLELVHRREKTLAIPQGYGTRLWTVAGLDPQTRANAHFPLDCCTMRQGGGRPVDLPPEGVLSRPWQPEMPADGSSPKDLSTHAVHNPSRAQQADLEVARAFAANLGLEVCLAVRGVGEWAVSIAGSMGAIAGDAQPRRPQAFASPAGGPELR